MYQRLGGNPTALGPKMREPPDRRPLSRWEGDQGWLSLVSHLVKKPSKAPSGRGRCWRLIPSCDVELTLTRRRQQRRWLRCDGGIAQRGHRVAEARCAWSVIKLCIGGVESAAGAVATTTTGPV